MNNSKIMFFMKKFFFLIILAFYIFGCSSSVDTVNMTPDQRLAYAKSLYNDEDYLDALNEFQSLLLQYPGNSIIDDAQYYLAMTRFKRGEYIMAAYEFSRLVKNMPASQYLPDAQFMLAESYYELSPNYSLDQKYTKKAIEEFQAFIDFFPTNPKVTDAEKKISEMNEKLAHKEYNSARIYEKMDYYTASLIYYSDVIETYHDTKYAPLAMYDKIKILLDRNMNDEALAEMTKFLEKYPDDSNVKEIQKLKTSLENKLSASK
jgi:outer membrane protein assembly factor BamD